MKLKQRLLLVPILILLYTLTKPFWTDEVEPWEHRKQKVGKLERREGKSNEPYGGAFVEVPHVDSRAPPVPPKPAQPKEQPRPYPVNQEHPGIPKPVDPGQPGAVGHNPIQEIKNQPIIRPDPPAKIPPQVPPKQPKSPQKLYPDEPPLLPKHNPVSHITIIMSHII